MPILTDDPDACVTVFHGGVRPLRETPDRLARVRLMQLVSPALPVGAYAYSQGLETAVALGWVANEHDLEQWVSAVMVAAVGHVDVPLLLRLHEAWAEDDVEAVAKWSIWLIAQRDTAELRQDERDRGHALARLLTSLGCVRAEPWCTNADATGATMFALASVSWHIDADDAAAGYVWSWLENAVIAGVKLVPLGQVAGQRVLLRVSERIPAVVEAARSFEDDDIGASLPGMSIASARHETQYSRLFRS